MSRLTEPQQRVLSLICEMPRFAPPPSMVAAPLRRLLRRRLATGRRLSSLMWQYSATEAGRIAIAKHREPRS